MINIIKYLLYKFTRWLEFNYPWFKKYQDEKRLKKWDSAPSPYGINSHTTPHLYRFLLGFRNRNSLTDFELRNILLLFSQEKFSPLSKEEFKDFLDNLNPKYLHENLEQQRLEVIALCEINKRRYTNTLKSFSTFDIISQTDFRRKLNGDDPVRNIKRLFCEFRILLKKHILDPDTT